MALHYFLFLLFIQFPKKYMAHQYESLSSCQARLQVYQMQIIELVQEKDHTRDYLYQLVEHRSGIAEVTGSNPVEALIFSGFFFPIA